MLLLAVIPLALITCLLSGYFIRSSQAELRDLFIQEGKDICRYLAKVTEFYMFSGDTDSLRAIGEVVLTENNVKSVSFFDPDGKILIQMGEVDLNTLASSAMTKQQSLWFFQQPVLYSALEVDDFSTADNRSLKPSLEKRTLGWVQTSVSESLLLEKQRRILFTGIFIASLGLAIAILMAIRLGRGITTPLSQLSNTVQQLESGNLSARAPELNGKEFRILAQGLNRMAERIEYVNEELQQRIAQATKQLTQTLDDLEQQNHALEQAQNDLIAADIAKDEFLARMSHELRTPLTSIMGYSELLEDMGLAEQQQEFNQIIKQSSDLLLSIINDILDFTKLRANAIELEMLPFNLEDCMEDVVAMHAHHAFAKGIELVLFIESDVPRRLIGDALRLRQIVNNLISNAIKFTSEGEVVIFVSIESTTEQTATINLLVKDSGIGIREKDLEHLFKEFSQADLSISRRFGGSGLGLVIVKRLAQLMGGDTQLTSACGQGVEASCQITLAIDHSSVPTNVLPKINLDQLLIYDQNVWSLRALRHHALKWTTNITTVTTQYALFQKLQQDAGKFNALIIGLSQQEMLSEPLQQLIRNIREYTMLPILLTGGAAILTLKGDSIIWQQNQPLDFISKPSRSSHFSDHLLALTSVKKALPFNAPSDSNYRSKRYAEQQLSGARILIAEDNNFNRRFITKILKMMGAEVFEASDGAQALQIHQDNPIDIFLLDLNMPEIDGLETATLIRQHYAKNKQPAIIALTAAITSEQDSNDKLSVFNEILHKPIRQDWLATTLTKYWLKDKKLNPPVLAQPMISVSKEELREELFRLAKEIGLAIKHMNRDGIKMFTHQILGVINRDSYTEITELTKQIELLASASSEEILNDHFNRLVELLAASFNRDS